MSTEFANRLRQEWVATKLSFTRFGVRRAVGDDVKAVMAHAVSANPDDVSAGKRLFDTKNPAYRDVTAVFSKCKRFWKELTMPFPQDGVRLLRQPIISEYNTEMNRFRAQLDQKVAALSDVYADLRYEARQRLGDLFCQTDYPDSLGGMFEIRWEFPSIDPPEYLKGINERIWQEQRDLADARLNEAVVLAEQAFAAEFQALLAKLVERLTPNELGEQKRFGDGVIENLSNFMERFSLLSVGSNDDLERLVAQAKDVIQGKDANVLRRDASFRENVKAEMTKISEQLGTMLVDAPRRSIILDD